MCAKSFRLKKSRVAEVDVNKCLLCKDCLAVKACHNKALSRLDLDEPPFVQIEYCLGCGECVKACPASAISIKM